MELKKEELLAAALQYADLGFAIIPLGLDDSGKSHKKPLVKWTEYQKAPPTKADIEGWFNVLDVRGIAMIVEGTDFVVIDVEKEGLPNIDELQLPKTVCSITGGGGRHFFFRCKHSFKDKMRFRPFMDMRRRGLIVLPPSLHSSGNNYAWEVAFGDCEIAELPKDLMSELMNDKVESKNVGLNFVEGSRNSTLTSLAGYLRHKGLEEDTICTTLKAVNARECKPPLPDKDVEAIAKSIGSYKAGMVNGVRSAVIMKLEDVVSEEVNWLWNNWVPYGKLTIIEGDPGIGKSSISMDLAAAVTRSKAMYGDDKTIQREPANVLLLAAEDGLADTIRPRLESAGADVNRVRALVAVKDEKGNEQHFSLEKDLELADKVLSEGGYKLLIIDPLNAYMGAVDTYKDSSVRSILTPLTRLAEKHGVALVCIRHLTKATGGRAMYRGQGSIAYTAAARALHVVGEHPEDPTQRVMSCTKNSLAPKPSSLAFKIEGKHVEWVGTIELSADALLAPALGSDDQSALDEAKEFLADILSQGAKSQKEIFKESKKHGIADKTLQRAKKALGVKSKKASTEWMWMTADETGWPPCPSSDEGLSEAENSKMAKVAKEEDMTIFRKVEWE